MGTSKIALERAQALLKVDTGSGSLYDHLARVVRKLADDKPEDALEQLENLSRHLKQSTFRGDAAPHGGVAIPADALAEKLQRQWCADSLSLASGSAIPRAPSDPTSAPEVLVAVQNFMEDAAMFEWAGVGFGKQESYHIAMSMRKLAADTPALENLRLWGKILGTEGDYYVAEGVLKPYGRSSGGVDPVVKCAKELAAVALENTKKNLYETTPGEGQAPPPIVLPGTDFDVEPRGQGANACAYWVSAGGASPWVRLPAARASHIVAARNVQKLFTGSLDTAISSTPWFPGDERDLLRAQIARITATCKLAVAGWWKVDENDPKKILVDTDEEQGNPQAAFADLDQPAGWVHASPYLLNNGRSDYGLEQLEAAQGEEIPLLPENDWGALSAALGKEQEFDEPKPMDTVLGAAIDTDVVRFVDIPTPGDGLDPENPAHKPWSIKVCGDKGLYGDEQTHRIVAVKSRIWPGAVAVAQADPLRGKKFANLYVGYALKCGTLVPSHPTSGMPVVGTCPVMPLEPGEVQEMYEKSPNPQDEANEPNPQEVEQESDAEQEIDDD
jgi:radial spoke head protein 4A